MRVLSILTLKISAFFRHRIYSCVLYVSQTKHGLFFQNNINGLMFVMDMQFLFCEIET
jgi:hypothetical protein